MKKWVLFSVLFLGAIALEASPAMAGITANSQETDISGETLELGDAFASGVSYTNNLSSHWGAESRYAFSPNDAEETPTGDLRLHNLNALYDLNLKDAVVSYDMVGVGRFSTNLDEEINGTVNETPVTIKDSNALVLNTRVGTRYFIPIDHVFLRTDAHYGHVRGPAYNRNLDDQLNTAKLKFGIGYRF